jgi:hypothetical protein
MEVVSLPMRHRLLTSAVLILASAIAAFSADTPPNTAPHAKSAPVSRSGMAPLLPHEFGGWELKGQLQSSTDPAIADPAEAGILKEYGFTEYASGEYTRDDDGRTLKLRAARFADTSGAYGAFTFYKQREMLNEKIGDQAASLNNRVLFYRGNLLVDAVFDKLSGMSAAELRELAAGIPLPEGGARNLPGLPIYLPKESYVKNTAKYVTGPSTLDKIGAPISSQLVDFNAGAETVLANYGSSGGEATLVLIAYPTPQIAAQHLRRIDAARQSANAAPSATGAPTDTGIVWDKRTGPIVAIAAGPLSVSEAKSLLAAVNYEADVTWNEATFLDKKNSIGNLVWNAIVLCGILIGIALVAGLAFGGLRVLVKRWQPEREGTEEIDFISLHLDQAGSRPPVRGSRAG